MQLKIIRKKTMFCLLLLLYISEITFSCTEEKTGPEKIDEEEVMPPNIIVIFTDDQGYADLGVQYQVSDIHTPNIDNLSRQGVRFTNGYVTAPVSAPSRIGLITGKYQERFGVESNGSANNFSKEVSTLPQRLKSYNYITGLVGKAHFGRAITSMGFDEYFMHQTGAWDPIYTSTHSLDGTPYSTPQKTDLRTLGKYRLEEETRKALRFIERHADQQFFLYLAYKAPHVPLEVPQEYLDRFASVEDKERQLCLAMLSAVDDGVGEIMQLLKERDIEEKTMVFFISDNGGMPNPNNIGYDASLNKPLLGEKGVLLEGGIRVLWIAYWKGTIPGGQVNHAPVISLDVAATALSLAGSNDVSNLDGINLLPYLKNPENTLPERSLFWYTRGQQAVRRGPWKLFRTTHKDFSFLVNLDTDIAEQKDLSNEYPDIANSLAKELDAWQNEMKTPPRQRHASSHRKPTVSLYQPIAKNHSD
jgi:uncharacterized sulfatase